MLQAMKTNTGEEWLQERVRKYGPISKLTLFGKPTVFVHRPATNKFIFYGDSNMLANKQPSSIYAILGDHSLFELSGQDHGPENFQEMVEGMWPIPVDLPFTHSNRSLRACSRVQDMLKELVREKKVKLEQHTATPHQDLITYLLSKHNEENERVVTDKEILHYITLVMIVGHDTSSILITFVLRLLYKNPAVYKAVFLEQEEIARSKTSGEPLTWEDLARMKYTWRVAMETPRIVPLVFGGFRLALRDNDYGGYLIPKGWQSIFPEPSKFDPARFEDQNSVPSYSFIPFGGGPCLCPGNDFVRIETLVAIHYLVTRYS
ncbi:hypothetical protein EUGRSUZ_F00898 [Eucalyptus grandis]|uniref:Uncharacterized protein n=1 Tax=Eucalyptus grandis TaxID=71139 RepID=A0ACC3KDB4_EUCGR|nr:hypothetical protein EUGRSUZ_F00898 [Eucalyptus grandis]